MVTTKYSFKNFDDHMARAQGKDLAISTKAAVTICNVIRGMDARKAVHYLQDVVDMKRAVPYTRFTDGVGHRKGQMAAGRYPVKAAKTIGKLIASAMANASALGMDDNLNIVHISAQKASTPLHQGRQTRRSMKRTHVEVVVREDESKAKAKAKSSKKKAPSRKSASKTASAESSSASAPKEQSSANVPKAGSQEGGSKNSEEQSTNKDAPSSSSKDAPSKSDNKSEVSQ